MEHEICDLSFVLKISQNGVITNHARKDVKAKEQTL